MAYILVTTFDIAMQDGPIAGQRLTVQIRVPVETYQLQDQSSVQIAVGPAYGVVPAFGQYPDMKVYLEPENEFYTIGVPETDSDIRAWRIVQ